MSRKENYDVKIETLKAIPDQSVVAPAIPVKVLVGEAEELYAAAQNDREHLEARGLDWTVVEDLPARMDTLKIAQSDWEQARRSDRTESAEWAEKNPEAYDMMDTLIWELRFALKENKPVQNQLDAIAARSGHMSMLQSLVELYDLGRKYQEALTETNFDLTLLDTVDQMADELADLRARAVIERKESSELKNIRDRAAMHLKEATDLIRSYGRFVFRKNKDKLKKYRSQYFSQTNSRNAETTSEQQEPELTPISTEELIEVQTPVMHLEGVA